MNEAKRRQSRVETLHTVETVGRQPEDQRELMAREAAWLFCERKHIMLIGRWEQASAQQLLNTLIGMYRTDIPFFIMTPVDVPGAEVPTIHTYNGESLIFDESLIAPEASVYPKLFVAFVLDTPEHRRDVDALLALTALNAGTPQPSNKLEEYEGSGPIFLLGDDDQVRQAVTFVTNALAELYRVAPQRTGAETRTVR